ncbi:MAG: PDC sensor domain-containing protein [Hydrogenothermaceae bacterium]|nr:PDC sensor domain-containing protein [Hydrogenothermaceae bacterium]
MKKFNAVLENVKDELCSEFTAFFESFNCQDLEKEEFIEGLFMSYSFVELLYVLDKNGVQISDNFVNPIFLKRITVSGKGVDRSGRIYYQEVVKKRRCIVTEPYKSISSPEITATVAVPIMKDGEIECIVCLDLNLRAVISKFEGGKLRTKFEAFTKFSYTTFAVFLIFIAIKLLSFGVLQIFQFKFDEEHIFESVILVTLSIAIFDLAKTIFEEEVLLYKDPRRHSEIRKTITRFLASIIIAVSIEALMLVFKFTISDPSKLLYALGLFFGIGFLIISLGVYVFLGSKAEISIKRFEKENN